VIISPKTEPNMMTNTLIASRKAFDRLLAANRWKMTYIIPIKTTMRAM
jgi:hypothetical protein